MKYARKEIRKDRTRERKGRGKPMGMKYGGKRAVRVSMAIAAALLAVIAMVVARHAGGQGREQVLHFGMMAGSYWDVPTGNCYEVVDAAIRRFEEKHPGVTVEYVSGILKEDYPEWMAQQVLLGKEPDVFMIPEGELDTFASLGVLKKLEPLMERDAGFDSSQYYDAAYGYGKIRDGQYALPYESVPTLMFVNKTLLEKEGIAMPGPDWTWDDFLSICRRVTRDTDGDGVIDQFGFFDYGWREAVDSNGAVLFEKDGKAAYFTDPRVEAGVRFVKDLNGANGGYVVTAREFDQGKVAFRPFAFSEYRTYKPYPWRIKKYSDFEWDCVKLPSGPDGRGQTKLDTLLMGISSRTKQEYLAWEFIKELCYEEETQLHLLEASQGMPVLKKAARSPILLQVLGSDTPGDGNMDVEVIRQVMEEAAKTPNFKKYPAAMNMADSEMGRIIDGNVSMDSGLLKLQREMNGLLKQ